MRPLLGLLLLALAQSVAAGSLTPMEAQGGPLIVDIRQPEEWRATGVVPDALRIPLYHPQGQAGLLAAFRAAVEDDLDRPIALICRTGSRSAMLQRYLQAQGFTRVYDISEGMLGGPAGPGWIARELPVAPCSRC